jgi:hypothetical protein
MVEKNQLAKRVTLFLIVLNIFIVLFPPLHWSLAAGNPPISVTYTIGSAVLVVVSLFVMAALNGSQKEI